MLLTTTGVAQGSGAGAAGRVATAVTVLDSSGQRAAQVALLCFGSPWCVDVDGVDDLVPATTDDRGMAIVRLLPGRSYTVAAAKAAGKTAAWSSVERDVLVAGAVHAVRLHEGQRVETGTLAGLNLWEAEGPLVVEVSPVMSGSFFVPAKQYAALPVLRMRVLAADGGPIWQGRVKDAMANGIPAPESMAVRVQSVGGRAIAGAAIWQQVPARLRDSDWRAMPPTRGTWRLVGVADESGEATVRVALRDARGRVRSPLLLQARADGSVPCQAGIDSRGIPFEGHAKIDARKGHVLRFSMAPAQQLRITPPAKYRVMVMGKGDHAAVAPIEEPMTVQTDGDGKAPLLLHKDSSYTRVAVIERKGHEPVWALLEQGENACELNLAATTIDLSVQDRKGNPVRGAVVSMTPYNEVVGFPGFRVPLRMDAAGRKRLRLNDGADWMFWSRQGDDIAWQVIPASPAGALDVVLKLQPMPRGKVRVVDANGAPAAGLSLVLVGMAEWRKLETPEHFFLSFAQRELDSEKRGMVATSEAGELWVPLLPLPGVGMTVTLTVLTTGQMQTLAIQPGGTAEMKLR